MGLFYVARREVLEVFEFLARLGKIYTTHTVAFRVGRFAFGGVFGIFCGSGYIPFTFVDKALEPCTF